jgi:hypothetical protein
MVPTNSTDWSADDRRAALLHELTHVANFDDWAGVAEEFVRAAFCLEQLDLQSAKLTTAGVAALKDLTQLRTLWVNNPADGDALGDAAVEPLLSMKKLRSLYLGKTQLTADGVQRLLALPDLRDLSLSSPALGEEARANLNNERPGLRLSISGPAKNTPPPRPQ